MVAQGPRIIPFGPSLKALLTPGTLTAVNQEPRYIDAAKIEFNELSGEPEELSLRHEQNAAIPVGSAAEGPWRSNIVAYNTGVIRNRQLYNVFAPPIIRGGLNLITGIADLFTLGLLGFRDKGRIDEATKGLTDIYGYKHLDTKVRRWVYGVPERRPGRQKVVIERGGSLPMTGYMGFDDTDTRDAYLDRMGRSAVDIDGIDSGRYTFRQGPMDRHYRSLAKTYV